jgi:hypothetical protein
VNIEFDLDLNLNLNPTVDLVLEPTFDPTDMLAAIRPLKTEVERRELLKSARPRIGSTSRSRVQVHVHVDVNVTEGVA